MGDGEGSFRSATEKPSRRRSQTFCGRRAPRFRTCASARDFDQEVAIDAYLDALGVPTPIISKRDGRVTSCGSAQGPQSGCAGGKAT